MKPPKFGGFVVSCHPYDSLVSTSCQQDWTASDGRIEHGAAHAGREYAVGVVASNCLALSHRGGQGFKAPQLHPVFAGCGYSTRSPTWLTGHVLVTRQRPGTPAPRQPGTPAPRGRAGRAVSAAVSGSSTSVLLGVGGIYCRVAGGVGADALPRVAGWRVPG
jgi:hypothetical protein